MLSGGLDSTFLLFHLLKTTPFAVHAHHISLRTTNEPRWAQEDEATKNVIEWCRSEVRPFDTSASRFDFPFPNYVGRDSDLQLLVAAKIAPNLRGRVRVALGWQKDDFDSQLFRDRYERKLTQNVWTSLRNSIDGTLGDHVDSELWFPLLEAGFDKAGMLGACPPELLALTWSCRTPVEGDFGLARPCGECSPCKKLKHARQTLLEREGPEPSEAS